MEIKRGSPRKWLGRFVIGTGLGDMIGFVLHKRKRDIKISNHLNRDFAVWFRTWDQTVVLGPGWREATQHDLTNRQAYELGRLIQSAVGEKGGAK